MTDETEGLDRIEQPPSLPKDPRGDFVFGLFQAFGEVCHMLVLKGVFTAEDLRVVMDDRAAMCRERSDMHALAAKTMADVAGDWAKSQAPAIPLYGEVPDGEAVRS